MKVLRKFWVLAFNIILVFLPAFLLAVLLYYYGQPFADRFKDFLGNPVTEFVSLGQEFGRRRPGVELYKHADRILARLAPREELTENEMQQLRGSVFKIHHASAGQIGIERDEAADTEPIVAYKSFLRNRQLERLFVHTERLRQNLSNDIERLVQLSDLPFHPARGLEKYITAGDTVSDSIRSYGAIYSDRHACQRVFTVDCSAVYSTSVTVASQQIEQYLSSWPQTGRGGDAGIIELNENLEEIYSVFQALTEQISGYLQAAPWQDFEELQRIQNRFRDNFISDLQLWYRNSLQQIEVSPRQFTPSAVSDIAERLSALKEIEQRMTQQPDLRNLLLNSENYELRAEKQRSLQENYIHLLASREFITDFEISAQKLEVLTALIVSFDASETFIDEQEELLTELRTEKQRLDTAAERQNYSSLTTQLENMDAKLATDAAAAWEIMLESFIKQTQSVFTDPDWQPVDRAGQQDYTRLVEAITDIGQQLNIDTVDAAWQQDAIVSMRSRRFTILRNDIRDLLEKPDSADIQDLATKLSEITALEDLPAPLDEQPPYILFSSTLVERIQSRTRRLREKFQSFFDDNPDFRETWDKIDSLLSTQEQITPGEALVDLNLKSHAEEFKNIITELAVEQPFFEDVEKGLNKRLEQFFTALDRRSERWMRAATRRDPTPEELQEMYENLLDGMSEARAIDGFSLNRQTAQWFNLLQLRQRLYRVVEGSDKLTRGRLMSENVSFQSYSKELQEYQFQSLPGGYDFSHEKELITNIHETVLDKAQLFQEETRSEWLAGWGGRLRGIDLLEPWEQFINTLQRNSDEPNFRAMLRDYHNQVRNLKREWQ